MYKGKLDVVNVFMMDQRKNMNEIRLWITSVNLVVSSTKLMTKEIISSQEWIPELKRDWSQ